MSQKPITFPLTGGLDLVSRPPVPVGRAIEASNYLPVAQGYERITGFERFDGQISPRLIGHWYVFHFTNLTIAPAVGARLVGVTSASGGFLVATAPVISTGILGGTNTGYIGGYWDDTLAYTVNENLRINGSGAIVGKAAAAVPVIDEAVPEASGGAWLDAAKVMIRGKIKVVPGSGPVRGVGYISGSVVGIRDDAGATKGVMYKATAGSWGPVDTSKTFTFNSGGIYEVKALDSLYAKDPVSGNIGKIKAVVVTSGTWAGGDAAGTITLFCSSGYPPGLPLPCPRGAATNSSTTISMGPPICAASMASMEPGPPSSTTRSASPCPRS
jgi:hypothetical protein